MKADTQIYELAISLLLTQTNVNLEWLENGIFHVDKDIRKITCNFLLAFLQRNNYQLDLFKMEEKK